MEYIVYKNKKYNKQFVLSYYKDFNSFNIEFVNNTNIKIQLQSKALTKLADDFDNLMQKDKDIDIDKILSKI